MADLEFKVVDKTKWETLAPATPAKKEDKYNKVLDALEAGEILEITTKDAKEMKGYRISLGRKASARGFRTEYRIDGNILYVKKSDTPVTPGKSKKKKEKVAQEA